MSCLVSCPVLTADRARLEEIHGRFRDAGYRIVDVALDPAEFHLASPEQLFADHDVSTDGEVVLLTNVLLYSLAWYRLWDDRVDHHVLFVDSDSPAFAAAGSDLFLTELASFRGIELEPPRAPLFVDLEGRRAVWFEPLFRQQRYIERLAPLKHFPFGTAAKPRPPRIPRNYRLGAGSESSVLALDGQDVTRPPIEIDLSPPVTDDGVDYRTVLPKNPALGPAIVRASLLSTNDSSAHHHRIVPVLESLKQYPELIGDYVDELVPLFAESQVPRTSRIHLAYSLGEESRDTRVLEAFTQQVRDEYVGTPEEFAGFVTSYLLQQWFKIPPYPGYFADQVEILRRVVMTESAAVLPHVTEEPSRGEKRLLILNGEAADDGRYGPSRCALGLARAFRKAFPDWQVALAVTDRHRMDDRENVAQLWRPVSADAEGALRVELEDAGAELFVADRDLPRRERTAALISRIHAWRPQCVISIAADRDVLRNMLFEHYPVLERVVGYPLAKPDDADVILSYHEPEVERAALDTWCVPEERRAKFSHYRGQVLLAEPTRVHTRVEYGFSEGAVVLGVVGYELRVFMRDEIVEMLVRLLTDFSNVEVALVGNPYVPRIMQAIPTALHPRVHVVGVVEDLPGFLHTCDALMAPRQPGGGNAHCIAMKQGVPLVVEGGHDGDLIVIVGRDNASPDLASFESDVRRIVSDSDYREMVQRRGTDTIKRKLVAQETAMERLIEKIQLAEERFHARTTSDASNAA